MRAVLLLLGLACALPAAGQFQRKSDWEEKQDALNWRENEVKLPAYPGREGLIEFFTSAHSSFRFYVDAASLSVAGDGVVRYTLVARSAAGVENITYEGIRCETSSYATFAHGNDGKWRQVPPEWKPVERREVANWRYVLRNDIFCPSRAPITTVAEGLDALRRGYHPALRVTPGHPSR